MATELTQLDLFEVSLVDAGDDPLAKVTLFKRKDNPNMGITKPKDDEKPETDAEEAMEDAMMAETKKALEAQVTSLLTEVETLKTKVSELEAEAVVKALVNDSILIDGEAVLKSAIPALVLKQLEELQKGKEQEDLRKLANEKIPHFKGTADQKAKLIKAVGDDKDLMEMLVAADLLFAPLMAEIGKTNGDKTMKSAEENLEDMTKAYAVEKKTTYEQAYAAVIKTSEGKALLRETRVK